MSSTGLQQPRPPALHPSALSPLEWESYSPLLAASDLAGFETEVEAAKAPAVWNWLTGWLGEVDKQVEEAILSFFRVPVAPPSPPSHILLALLRLYSHSKTSKHLTRDLIFIQTDPASLKNVSELASTSWTNPFRRANSPATIKTGMAPLSSPVILSPTDTMRSTTSTTSTAPSSRGPAPPPPAKRRPISPPSFSSPEPIPPRPSTNPFRGQAFSSNALLPSQQTENPGPYALPASPPPSNTSASPSYPASTSNEHAIASPPLPPRPATKEKHASPSRLSSRPPSIKAEHPVPRPPVRRSSSASTTTPPVLSIIGSSAPSHRSSSILATHETAPFPRSTSSKLVASSHIGPTTRLRNSPSPVPPAAAWEPDVSRSRPMERSDSAVSNTSINVATSAALNGGAGSSYSYAPPTKKSWISPLADDDAPPLLLSRSRTLGSKPIPPPPKRRPESLSLDPFGDSSAQRPTHQRTLSLSSRKSSPATIGGGGRKDLGALVGDVGALFQQGGRQSEEWIAKAREGIKGRRRGERERLVGGEEEEEEEGEEDREVLERRREVEREGREGEEGWSRL